MKVTLHYSNKYMQNDNFELNGHKDSNRESCTNEMKYTIGYFFNMESRKASQGSISIPHCIYLHKKNCKNQ